MDSFLVGLMAGIPYGCMSMFTFVVIGLLGVAAYDARYDQLPVGSEFESLLWFWGSLGTFHIVIYALLALVWPVSLTLLWLLFARFHSYARQFFFGANERDVLPKKTRERIEWFCLGFGKIQQR